MPRPLLSTDTPVDIEQRQIAQWRQMSAAQKAAVVSGLTEAAVAMARAGIRHRHSDASPREQVLRLAIVILGLDLAQEAYPEIASLDLR